MKKIIFILLLVTFFSGCASPRKRFLLGAGAGALAAGGTAAALAPSPDSQGMNAVVFGLSGALIGGTIALFTYDDGAVPSSKDRLEEKERALSSGVTPFQVEPKEPLPTFVKDRLTPVVVESYVEKDAVAEDGTLHEPHRVYRIKQPAELITQPIKPEPKK